MVGANSRNKGWIKVELLLLILLFSIVIFTFSFKTFTFDFMFNFLLLLRFSFWFYQSERRELVQIGEIEAESRWSCLPSHWLEEDLLPKKG